MSSSLSQNELLKGFHGRLLLGQFGDAEWVEVYCGRADAPLQMAVRDRRSGRVRLIDQNRNGSIHDPSEPPRN